MYEPDADSCFVSVKKDGIRSLHYNNGLEWSPLLYDRKQLSANIVPKQASLRVYTEGILMSLPTPDFSKKLRLTIHGDPEILTCHF